VGRFLLVVRLGAGNLRRRPVEAVLLVLAITAATTTLTLGLALRGVTDDPYRTTRAATAGPDVVATVSPVNVGDREPGRSGWDRMRGVPADLASLDAVAGAPGVVDHGGPYPAFMTELDAGGTVSGVWVQARDPGEAAVDQPEVIEGSWVEDGGAVVEAGFADALGVGEGDRITLLGRELRVAGTAVTAATRPYPDVCVGFCPDVVHAPGDENPFAIVPGELDPDAEAVPLEVPPLMPGQHGLVWLTRADAAALGPSEESLSYVVNLRLADPSAVQEFVEEHPATTAGAPVLDSWLGISEGHHALMEDQQLGLQTGAWLLALLAVSSVAVLMGGRLADQTRRVGLLKAVGGTPGLVTAVLLAEYLAVALLAAAAGLVAGRLAAPLLTDPGAGLLGSAGAPSLTLATVGVVTALALVVSVAATAVPAVRAARTSTVDALADAARPPRRTPWLIALSARLPVPLLLGLRTAARRPRRVVLSMVSIAVAVSGIVTALAAHASLVAESDPNSDRLNQVLLVITVMLGVLAATNAIFVTWATALDTQHSSTLARALGATPRQVSVGLSAAQVLPSLAGAVLGIAGGLALYDALSGDEAAYPPLWQLLAVVPVTVVVVAALTSVPARIGARRPTAALLQGEHA
jgi:ABC-type lipoprotein release transport system permease subunit